MARGRSDWPESPVAGQHQRNRRRNRQDGLHCQLPASSFSREPRAASRDLCRWNPWLYSTILNMLERDDLIGTLRDDGAQLVVARRELANRQAPDLLNTAASRRRQAAASESARPACRSAAARSRIRAPACPAPGRRRNRIRLPSTPCSPDRRGSERATTSLTSSGLSARRSFSGTFSPRLTSTRLLIRNFAGSSRGTSTVDSRTLDFAGRRVVDDRLHRVDAGRELRLAIEDHVALLRRVDGGQGPVDLVVLADLARDLVLLVEEANDDREIGRVGLSVRRRLERERRGLEFDDDRHEAGPIALGKSQRAGAHRKRVRHWLLLEGAERRRFPRVDRRAARIAEREVAFACGDCQARAASPSPRSCGSGRRRRRWQASSRGDSSCEGRPRSARNPGAGCSCSRTARHRSPAQAARARYGDPAQHGLVGFEPLGQRLVACRRPRRRC